MKLNRHNYEEYFILYLDNELDSEDRREVELFASEHPDLKAELDILLQSKLSPDTDITFGNKESLLARDSSSISMNNYEQWLFSYIDNELTTEEVKDIERFIAEHPEVKTELGLLQKTKLQPEAIVFPDKESLYRKEEKAKVVAIHWRRWAVAAALLIGISTTAIVLFNSKSETVQGPVAKAPQNEEKTNSDNPVKQPVNGTPIQNAIADNDPQITESTKEPVTIANNHQKNVTSAENKKDQSARIAKEDRFIAADKQETNNLPDSKDNPNVNTRQPDPSNLIASSGANIPSKDALTNFNENTASSKVTPGIVQTSYSQTGAPPDDEFGADQPDGKKNKLRGFFRKITRTFEKRTNIKATDDEDRLLIAGLAIKLN
jgi:hypothetical protein